MTAGNGLQEGPLGHIHHLGLVVSDLDEAVKFYGETLGMVLESFVDWTTMPGTLLGIEADAIKLRWAFMTLGSTRFEFHEFAEVPAGSPAPRRTQDPGLGHIALQVSDIHASVARLDGMGVRFFSEPNLLTGLAGQEGDWWVYGRDPFGLTIELYQRADTTD